MTDIRGPIEERLHHLTLGHLSRIEEYVPGQIQRAGSRESLLTELANDPVFSIFGLDSLEYIAATLSGGTITSIHRKLGDIYEQSVVVIFEEALGLTTEELEYSATIVVDEDPEERSIDAFVPFDRLDAQARERFENYCGNELARLTDTPQITFTGVGFEVRHCYQTGDSKRTRADLVMARHLLVSGILPLIPFFCSHSNRSVVKRYTGVWVVKEGLESYSMIRTLSGFDYLDFLQRNRDDFREPVINQLRSLTT